MDFIKNIIEAAIAILGWAKDELTRFVTDNTPESALLAAIFVAWQSQQSGALSPTQFAVAVISAIVVFVYAESRKDAALGS